MLDARRQFTTAFLFRVTPVTPGTFTIPPIAIRSRGITYHTAPITYQVHPQDSLIKLPSGIGNHQILAGWFPDKTTLYQKERCQVSLKLYIPLQLPIAINGWGLPTPAKDNCLAWRFSLPQTHEISQVTIDGTSYRTATFDTSLSGIRPGTATFGPAPLRIIVRQSVLDPLRGSRLTNKPIHLTLPATTFKILPLPKGAPQHFNNAVGQFTLQTSSDQTELHDSSPTEVILTIKGKGNLETLQAPQLSENTWKIIDSSKNDRDNERRSIEGSVTFRQLLRPQLTATDQLPDHIPAYVLSYFDPSDHSYHTVKTTPIPVHITHSLPEMLEEKAPPLISEKLGTTPEEMRNILGFIHNPDNTDSLNTQKTRTHSTKCYPSPLWHLFPAALALIIISLPLLKKMQASRIKHPDALTRQKELSSLAQEPDTLTFYRESGRFIERWLSQHKTTHSADLQKILTERDAICFKENTSPTPDLTPALSPKQKKAILSLLKQASQLCLILLTLITPTFQSAQANDASVTPSAEKAWQAENYQQALDLYKKAYPSPTETPPDILYNIGNCHYHLNQPGLASLAWRRTLDQDPTHPQAQQNLRFLEFTQHSIVPHYEPWQTNLLTFEPFTYRVVFYTSLWVFSLSLLTLIFLRPRGKWAALIITLLIIAPVSATLGGLAGHWYPNDHRFAPISQQALTLEKTTIYSEPHHLSDEAIQLPVGSLLRIEAVRGPWVHVHTADNQHGWVQQKEISPVVP